MMGVGGPEKAVAKRWKLPEKALGFVLNRRASWGAIALGDGSVALLRVEDRELGEIAIVKAHEGVSLSLCADAEDHAFLSGGDDGRVLLIDPALAIPTEIACEKNRWIDHVASSVSGERAYASGKKVFLLSETGEPLGEPREHESSIGGLAFSPNGKRLAAAHYNGASIWWTNARQSPAEKLLCKGSHLAPVWSPDGKVLMTSMQENALHGWFVEEKDAKKREMHMQGYRGKIHSKAFTAKARYLATDGMEQVVCWPFFNGGPWGKAPMTLGGTEIRLVSFVAPHPRDEMLAAGYDDGMIILAPFDGRMEIMLMPPAVTPEEDGTTVAAIVGLAWNEEGDGLFAVREDGEVFLFTLASISRSVRGR